MTEYVPPGEVPVAAADDIGRARRIAAKTRRFLGESVETSKETLSDEFTQRVIGGLAIVAAVSSAAEYGHWFDHTNFLLEFFQNSGRHFLVGYLGALAGMAGSKAETFRGKLSAALLGGLALDVIAEGGQAVVITGIFHHGSLHDMMGIFEPSQLPGNGLDALAAEAAAVGAAAQTIARR